LDKLSRNLDRPILSAFDAVVGRILDNFPLMKTGGLLATNGTIQGGLFQEKLMENRIQAQVPDGEF